MTTAEQGSLNVTPEEKTIVMVAHLLGIPLSLLGPLVILLVKADASDAAKAQIKEALNFQITMFIASMLTFGLAYIVNIVFCIIAGMAINEGKDYRYPFALRLVK